MPPIMRFFRGTQKVKGKEKPPLSSRLSSSPLTPRTQKKVDRFIRDKPIRDMKRKFTKLEKQINRCAICLEIMKHDQEITTLSCTHEFHTSCITHWFRKHNTCPKCRKPMFERDDNYDDDSSEEEEPEPGPEPEPEVYPASVEQAMAAAGAAARAAVRAGVARAEAVRAMAENPTAEARAAVARAEAEAVEAWAVWDMANAAMWAAYEAAEAAAGRRSRRQGMRHQRPRSRQQGMLRQRPRSRRRRMRPGSGKRR